MLHNALHIQSNNYNASTNTPALATTTGYNDNIFQVTTQGIQSINGASSFCGVGDEIVVSVGVSKFFTVTPVQYAATSGVATGSGPDKLTTYIIGSDSYLSISNYNASTFSTYKWDGSAFVSIGASVATGTNPRGIISYVIGADYYISLVNYTSNTFSTYKWNGTAFVSIGTAVATGVNPYNLTPYTIGSDTYISVCNTGSSTFSTYKWDGSAFVSIGAAVATGGSPYGITSYLIGADRYISVANDTSNTFSTYKWDGTAFVSIGAAVATGINPQNLVTYTIATEVYLSVTNGTSSTFSTYKWNGAAFVSIGAAVATGINPLGITAYQIGGESYLSITNTAAASFSTYKWDGTAFVSIGAAVATGTSPRGISSYLIDGDMYVSVANNGNANFATYKWNGATFASILNGSVGGLPVTITQLQQIGRIITISVAGTQTINGVATNMAVGQAWEYNGVSWLNIISDQAKMVAVQTATSSDLMTRIIYPTDAYYNSVYSAGVQTGVICITLPVAIKVFNTMFKMTVNIYDYNQPTTTSSIYIAGYWAGGIAAWNYPSATITSGSLNANFPISFGVNGSGVPCIYIGKVTSTWSAVMRVSIDNLLASYSGATIAHLSSGWNIGIVDSIVGTPIVLNSNFTQAKGLYDIDAAGNVLTQVNSTSARFMGSASIYPNTTYKIPTQLGTSLKVAQQLSSDLTYQSLVLSPVGSTATGGTGWARLYKYDADGLNPTYKQLFSMDPDTGVVSFTYIPTAPTAALGDNTTQLATTAFVIANANPTSSYATQAEVNAGTITNKAIAPSTFAASTQLAAKAPLVSPALTGTPTAPTAAVGTNTTQLATTAFVQSHIAPGNYAQLAANNTFTGTNTFSGLTNGSIGALKQITNFGTNVTYGVVSISTNGAQVPHANLAVQGNGDSNGYGLVMTTPNGVYAPTGNSQLGALTMQQRSVANLGISYPNIPGATSYTMGFGWDGSHVRCMVDNNTGVVPVLANLSDVIGVGQTWQNVTGSRAIGVNYTNTTSKPILVELQRAGGTFCQITVDGNSLPGNDGTFISSFVLPGETYALYVSGGSLFKVWELR